MKNLLFILTIVLFTACGNNATEQNSEAAAIDTVSHTDSTKKSEEDEMAEEVIQGSFDALNR